MEPSPPASQPDALGTLLDQMIERRNAVCADHALTISHKHCIGCVLVMDHMRENHQNLEYGTQEQWVEETAYCQWHEREIFRQFLRERGVGL